MRKMLMMTMTTVVDMTTTPICTTFTRTIMEEMPMIALWTWMTKIMITMVDYENDPNTMIDNNVINIIMMMSAIH